MNSDWNYFIVVSFLLFLMIMLCNYMINMALVNKDWVNLKCNPLYMLLFSISQNNDKSADMFKNCVNNV